ncbi:MAG: hypothetical protein Phog2KO_24860 [Phototrophicaceae bacterium]
MCKIFISYRWVDSAPIAGQIYEQLAKKFGESNIFFDTANSNLPPGADIKNTIAEALHKSDVLIIIMGPKWADELNAKLNQTDYVRFEVQTSLNRGSTIKIIPILVMGVEHNSLITDLDNKFKDIKEYLQKNISSNLRDAPDDYKRDLNKIIQEIEANCGGCKRRIRLGAIASLFIILSIFLLALVLSNRCQMMRGCIQSTNTPMPTSIIPDITVTAAPTIMTPDITEITTLTSVTPNVTVTTSRTATELTTTPLPTNTLTVTPLPTDTATITYTPTISTPEYLQNCILATTSIENNFSIPLEEANNIPPIDGVIDEAWTDWHVIETINNLISACASYSFKATIEHLYLAINVCDDDFVAPTSLFVNSDFTLNDEALTQINSDLLFLTIQVSNQNIAHGSLVFPRRNFIQGQNISVNFSPANNNNRDCQSVEIRIPNTFTPSNGTNTQEFEFGLILVDFNSGNTLSLLSNTNDINAIHLTTFSIYSP